MTINNLHNTLGEMLPCIIWVLVLMLSAFEINWENIPRCKIKREETKRRKDKSHCVFHNDCTDLHFPQELSFLISPPILVSCLFEDSHSDSYEVVSHVGFDLHLPDDQWCWASFHMTVGHLYVFFRKMSIHVLCQFLIRFLFFWYWVV